MSFWSAFTSAGLDKSRSASRHFTGIISGTPSFIFISSTFIERSEDFRVALASEASIVAIGASSSIARRSD